MTLGILVTNRDLGPLNLSSVALIPAGSIYAVLQSRVTLHSRHLMLGGVFCLMFLAGPHLHRHLVCG